MAKQISKKAKEKYVKQRVKQLLDMGFSEKEILGRAKNISSFWDRKRNYETFKKRANELVKNKKKQRLEIIKKVERKANEEIEKLDTSKITPIKGQKNYTFTKAFVEEVAKQEIRAKAYIEELSKQEYDEDTKYYLDNYSDLFDTTPINLKHYDLKHGKMQLKRLREYNIDIVKDTIQGERDFIQNIFTGGKMATIDPKLQKKLIKAIQSANVKQLNELYKSYNRDKIIEEYQDWKILENPVYSISELENKARWLIGKLSSK